LEARHAHRFHRFAHDILGYVLRQVAFFTEDAFRFVEIINDCLDNHFHGRAF